MQKSIYYSENGEDGRIQGSGSKRNKAPVLDCLWHTRACYLPVLHVRHDDEFCFLGGSGVCPGLW